MLGASQSIHAIDLFCGVGGLSCGLKSERIKVVAGVDLDRACAYPFRANHRGSKFLLQDVASLQAEDLHGLWAPGALRLLAGCAPCQPFSSYANTKVAADASKWGLLNHFGRLVEETVPDLVTMENVPGLAVEEPFENFLAVLQRCGYQLAHGVLNAADFGAPQHRKRLVLVASRLGPVALPAPTHPGPKRWRTVRQALRGLPELEAGQACSRDPLHLAANLSPINLQRIRAARPGGTWRDWPEALVAACHQKESGKHSAGVYGRMEWDKPAPTMTTLCNGFGNGRFGHPEQDRAISLREAAIFQSFPRDYRFVPPGQQPSAKNLARLIGNAVPPKLGAAVARALKASIGAQ